MNPTKAAAMLALIVTLCAAGLTTACTHKTVNMLVTYNHAAWDTGEIKDCEKASGTSVAPDRRGDVLLCDSDVHVAWIRSQKDEVYAAARTYSVTFLSSGKDEPWVVGPGHDTFWDCKKTADGIECR